MYGFCLTCKKKTVFERICEVNVNIVLNGYIKDTEPIDMCGLESEQNNIVWFKCVECGTKFSEQHILGEK